MSSRFSRTNPPTSELATAPVAPVTAPPGGSAPMSDLLARHQALQARGQEQNQRRSKYEGRLDHVIEQDKELAAQAQALGAKTPEELLSKIEAQDKADAEALDHYEAALNEEKGLLDAIDRELAELDAAE